MKIILTILTSAIYIFAQDEFVINSIIDSTQRDAQIERFIDEKYIVVWNSVAEADAGDIVLQFFNNSDSKVGTEIIVNEFRLGEQEKPALATNGNGRFIVTWASHNGVDSIYDVKARLWKNEAFSEEFIVNSTVDFSQTNPAVAMDSEGNFTIAWESWYQDGSDRGVYAQRYFSNGLKNGEEFRVNTLTAYSQARPAIKFFNDGKFLVIWESWKQDISTPAGYGILGQLFDIDGNKIGSEFGINTQTNDYQWFGDLEIFTNGNFFVTWCSWQQDGDKGGIFLQKFNQNSQKIGPEIQVNKTVQHYQWLPRIKRLNDEKFAIVWSSWEQDGNREGVVAQLFDSSGAKMSFETSVNLYRDSFQWEPDFIATENPDELLVTWSSWGQLNEDYEVIGRRIKPAYPIGFFDEKEYLHSSGNSTFSFIVHVVDSNEVIDSDYEIYFENITEESFSVFIKNLATGEIVIDNYEIDNGEDRFYLSPTFDGIAVEFKPIFEFNYDFEKSYFKNSSGTSLIFNIKQPTLGVKKLAPIDVALIWGSSDTLSDGSYAMPLDTVSGYYGDVLVPFKGWNLTDNEQIELFVGEDNKLKNNFWEVGEKIVFLTPEKYRDATNNTHVEILSQIAEGELIMPAPGDTHFVYTKRPIKEEDVFRFSTNSNYILDLQQEKLNLPEKLTLSANYPNPFNPSTTLRYSITKPGIVKIDVFNALGQKVRSLLNEKHNYAGDYRILFNGTDLASGLYFAVMHYNNFVKTRKMLLIK